MPKSINSLSRILDKVRLPSGLTHRPSVPAQQRTPFAQKSKVVSNPARVPINRQTALVIRPNRDWLQAPLPPEKLPNPHLEAVKQIEAQLKIERNAHALTKDQLGQARARIRELTDQRRQLDAQIQRLREELKTQADIIRQLEDLRL